MCIQCHGANHIGGIRQAFRLSKLQTPDREHGLGAVDQTDAFLGVQFDRRKTRAGQRFIARVNHAFQFRLALADQNQRHMS